MPSKLDDLSIWIQAPRSNKRTHWTPPDHYGAIYGMSLWPDRPSPWRHVLPQGLRGHHALFEPELVRFTMQREEGPELDPEGVSELRALLSALESASDDDNRRDRVAKAPLEVQETLIRAYFTTLFDYLDRRSMLAN